jgi:hypothetical protein
MKEWLAGRMVQIRMTPPTNNEALEKFEEKTRPGLFSACYVALVRVKCLSAGQVIGF